MIVQVFILMFLGTTVSLPLNPAPLQVTPEAPTTTEHAPIIGFDCNKTDPEVLTMSALEVGPCPLADQLKPKVDNVFGQIIQKHEFSRIMIRTCQFTKSTFYFKCGKNWYNYQVYPPSIGTIVPIPAKVCDRIHTTGTYHWSAAHPVWEGIEINQTSQRSVNEVGWTDKYGYCEGGVYTIGGSTHTDVVVQSSLTLSIRESSAQVDSETGKINIENALSCSYSTGQCTDAMTGTHVWTPIASKCPEDKYVELYKGSINITKDPHEGLTLLSVNRPPFLFTAELGTKSFSCSMSYQLTEFPGVLFVPVVDGSYQVQLPKPSSTDIQFITYLNAKLTFSYHNLYQSAQMMFLQAMQRSCEIERDVLKNRIEIIRLTSNSGALSTLLQGGMFAKANGEVIHVLKCEPIPVQLRNTKECYDALPIISQGRPTFLLPNTHIITTNASRIPCSPITPLTYRIGGKWWAFTGSFQQITDPQIISPRGFSSMKFTQIRSFSRGGMYSSDQIEAVQKMFSFPTLREAITTNIAAGVTNYYGKPIPMDISNIMSEKDLESIAEKNLKKWWGVFSSIGSAISGFIGIYFVFRLIKGVINTIIDAKELYGVFGVSFRLLAALWTRLALYFLNQARTQTVGQQMTPQASEGSSTDRTADGACGSETGESVPMLYYPSSVFHTPASAPLDPLKGVHSQRV